jgi:hypothetical protein
MTRREACRSPDRMKSSWSSCRSRWITWRPDQNEARAKCRRIDDHCRRRQYESFPQKIVRRRYGRPGLCPKSCRHPSIGITSGFPSQGVVASPPKMESFTEIALTESSPHARRSGRRRSHCAARTEKAGSKARPRHTIGCRRDDVGRVGACKWCRPHRRPDTDPRDDRARRSRATQGKGHKAASIIVIACTAIDPTFLAPRSKIFPRIATIVRNTDGDFVISTPPEMFTMPFREDVVVAGAAAKSVVTNAPNRMSSSAAAVDQVGTGVAIKSHRRRRHR